MAISSTSVVGTDATMKLLTKQIRQDIQSAFRSQTDKTLKKIDKIDRHIGAMHEQLCRQLLWQNMNYLVKECSGLEGFASFTARMSCKFVCVSQICNHLQLRPREYADVKLSLLQYVSSNDDVGRHVLSNFLDVLIHELEQCFTPSRARWPKYAVNIEESKEDVIQKLLQPFMMPEIVPILKNMKELGKSSRKPKGNLWHLCDHVDHLIHLLSVSEGKHDTWDLDIMEEPWGLLVVFWMLKGRFQQAVLEVDIKGTINRSGSCFTVCFGEIKSSDGVAMEKGKKQLDLVQEVYEHVLAAAVPNFVCNITKCLFIVDTTQRSTIKELIQSKGDLIVVDVNRLSY